MWTSLRNCASFGFWSRRPAGSPFGASCWSLCSGLDPLLNRGWCESMRELKNQTFFNYLAVTSFLLQFSWSSSLFLALIITNGLCLGGRKAWAACRLYALWARISNLFANSFLTVSLPLACWWRRGRIWRGGW